MGSGNGALGSIVALSPGLAWGVEGTTQLLSLPGSEDAEWHMGDWLLGVAPPGLLLRAQGDCLAGGPRSLRGTELPLGGGGLQAPLKVASEAPGEAGVELHVAQLRWMPGGPLPSLAPTRGFLSLCAPSPFCPWVAEDRRVRVSSGWWVAPEDPLPRQPR